ncbi:hypothetical protein VE03_01318 [Pseudogymnoascus sp. 23342-1-I1]|nr:hypothetical protein VE03_01318 [Pseudogymnoascus sp. 23342-1-I1]
MSSSPSTTSGVPTTPPTRRRRNNTAPQLHPPHTNGIINILAASPHWTYQGGANAGPAPAAAFEDAGQFGGQFSAAGVQISAGHQFSAGGQFSAANEATTPPTRTNPCPLANPSPPPTPPPLIPTIIITTPGMHLHLPSSPTLTLSRRPPHHGLRKKELQHRILELEQRVKEMEDEATAQEMVAEGVWRENCKLRRRVEELEGEGERGGVLVGGLREMLGGLEGEVRGLRGVVGGLRGMVGGWKTRAEVAEGVLRVLMEGAGEGGEAGDVFVDCE